MAEKARVRRRDAATPHLANQGLGPRVFAAITKLGRGRRGSAQRGSGTR
jgi:hypothetical protein